MKYIILRCEDFARSGGPAAALLEGAKTAHLQQLAQAGAIGLIGRHGKPPAVDRFHLHRALFGLGPQDVDAAPARCYAASVNLQLAPGETAWCADLMTHQDDRIIDSTAGNIPTKESEVLIHSLNERLGSATQRWEVGDGPHHLFVVSGSPLGTNGQWSGRAPELLVGHAWKRVLPKSEFGKALQSLIEEAASLLESHAINRVRIDLGENPANIIWLWGPADDQPCQTFAHRTGLSGAITSNSFPMRGLAHALGLDWKEAPASLEERAFARIMKVVAELIERHDLVYVHLRIGSGDPVERLCAMERIDQLLLKPLTERLPSLGPWRLLAAIDDRKTGAVPFVAVGNDLPQQPAARLDAQSLAESPLAFEDGVKLFSWFTK